MIKIFFAFIFLTSCGYNFTDYISSLKQQNTKQTEIADQEKIFNYYWKPFTFETKLTDIPKEGKVPDWRIPYSGYIYPESSGGVGNLGGTSSGLFRRARTAGGGSSALVKYDQAFNKGQNLANQAEISRIMGKSRAIFPHLAMRRNSEGWFGYCNGWSAAAIRHPEPIFPVTINGVTFQPWDIKALLVKIYQRTTEDSIIILTPAPLNGYPNPATLFLIITNYIGRGHHPIAFDNTPGKESWNYPIYAYKADIKTPEQGSSTVSVSLTVTFAEYLGSDQQGQRMKDGSFRTQRLHGQKTYRFFLYINNKGEITGGKWASNSPRLHFAWLPLFAVQGKGTVDAPGNPYIDVLKVFDLARKSADPQIQKKFDETNISTGIDPNIEKTETE